MSGQKTIKEDYVLAVSTCGNREEALLLARALTAEQLAACVNILPDVLSVYRWKGKVEEAPELLLLIKTRRDLVDRLQNRLSELHSYETPELIVVPIDGGLPSYLAWIGEETLRLPAAP